MPYWEVIGISHFILSNPIMVAKECLWKQLTYVVLWLEYMESPLIVYVSLLTESMGTKCNIYIHRTELKRTNLYWTNISTIYNNKSIQHNSTDSLDPPWRLNRNHGDSGKMSWLDIIWQSVKNKRIVKQKTSPHRWHLKLSKWQHNVPPETGKLPKWRSPAFSD